MNPAVCWACAALVVAQALLPMMHVAEHGAAVSARAHEASTGAGATASGGYAEDSGTLAWTGAGQADDAHDPAHCVLCSLARKGQAGEGVDAPVRLAEPPANWCRVERSLRQFDHFIVLSDAPPRGPPFVS